MKELDRKASVLRLAVYSETFKIFESLEDAGKVRGNGHHMAQEVAEYAVKLLRERWGA